MKKIIIVFILLIIVLICYILLKKGNNIDNSKLIFFEYNYSSYDDMYDSITISSNTMMVTYKDKTKNKISIDENILDKLNEVFKRYDINNWSKYGKKDIEYIDGDNTSIYYEYSNGEKGHITKEEYPKGKEKVFSEVKNLIEQMIK